MTHRNYFIKHLLSAQIGEMQFSLSINYNDVCMQDLLVHSNIKVHENTTYHIYLNQLIVC